MEMQFLRFIPTEREGGCGVGPSCEFCVGFTAPLTICRGIRLVLETEEWLCASDLHYEPIKSKN